MQELGARIPPSPHPRLGQWQLQVHFLELSRSALHPQAVLRPWETGGPLQGPSSPSTARSLSGTSRWRRHLLASQPEFASGSGRAPLPGSSPGWTQSGKRKRKDREKEEREGESGRQPAGEPGGTEEVEEEQQEQERRWRKAAAPPSWPANLLDPRAGGSACGARTMCLCLPRRPAAGRRAPSASSGRAGRLRGRPKRPCVCGGGGWVSRR